MRVLVIEDHHEVADLIRRALARDGHHVAMVANIADADSTLNEKDYDLAVLDLGLPDGDGVTWCRRVRADGVKLPILVLTAQSAVARRVEGLDAGADDFLAKPFAIAELRARVRALSRRGSLLPTLVVEHDGGNVQLDFPRRTATVRGAQVPLTPREWNILELLSSAAGRVLHRRDIVDRLWSSKDVDQEGGYESAESSLEVLVGRIRKKLVPSIVRTIRGEGYAFGFDDEDQEDETRIEE